MKLALKFIVPLFVILGITAYGVVPLVDALNLRWAIRDLDIRSGLVANTLQHPLLQIIETRDKSGKHRKIDVSAEVNEFFSRAIQDERLFALGYCNSSGMLEFKTVTFPANLSCKRFEKFEQDSEIIAVENGRFHVARKPIVTNNAVLGSLVVIHDLSYVDRRSSLTKNYVIYLFLGIILLVSFVTVLVAHLSQRGLVKGMRALLKGESLLHFNPRSASPELLPIAKDLRALVRDLEQDRRLRDESQITWTPRTLKKLLNEDLAGDEVLIVSNREPYIHVKKDDKIEVQVPASGLVTALEPIMRACSGTWIAHGSGSADREVVDKKDHIRVPPENPAYQIRRVWLNPEEEQGYYYGFSNEGLWPLCHIAHTRPTFRTSDWKQYYEVNKKFAEVVVQEAKTDDPVVLVQDYHFALLPKMVRDRLPKATIITFWHIPWPNPEAFGICPWREEIINGLLGSSILGFHTKFHCNNFVDTVDRFVEARIDRENSTISHGGKLSAVRSYPISIEWPPRWLKTIPVVSQCKIDIRKRNNLDQDIKLGVGVDRLDYTKGIIERFMAVERLLELYPEWIGQFVFIQIAAPSRSSIGQYQEFEIQVRALADRINAKFQEISKDREYKPILLKIEHHEAEQVFEYYRAADLCMVTSLHDGMNLVAKEYVSSRDDEQGALILSQFTGASRELPESLVVNPYNIDQCAAALHVALSMPEKEQRDRMRSMRSLIQEFNVYRWAGRMLMDASRMRKRQRLMGRIQTSENLFNDGLEEDLGSENKNRLFFRGSTDFRS